MVSHLRHVMHPIMLCACDVSNIELLMNSGRSGQKAHFHLEKLKKINMVLGKTSQVDFLSDLPSPHGSEKGDIISKGQWEL